MNPTKNLIDPKLYIIPTINLIELKHYMNPTKNLIEANYQVCSGDYVKFRIYQVFRGFL
jgi:hypothetical protein